MLDRIKALMAARQLSPSQFADQTTLPRPVVSHILSGRNKPSLEAVQKILAAYPDVSVDWLLNGRGEMLNGAPLIAQAPVPAPLAVPETAPAAPPAEPAHEPQASPAASKRPSAARVTRTSPEPAAPPQQPLEALTAPFFAPTAGPAPYAPYQGGHPNSYPGAYPGAYPPGYQQAPPPPPQANYQSAYPPGYQQAYVHSAHPQASPQPAPIAPEMPNGAFYPTPPPAAQQAVRPDKVVRRILVFYSDGSFSDHRPLSPEDNPFLW